MLNVWSSSVLILSSMTVHHPSVLSKGRPFTANSVTKAAILLKGRSSTANSGTKVAVLLGMNSAVASHCFPHPTLSLASEQALKKSEEILGALRTSPTFTTEVKYQFVQGF